MESRADVERQKKILRRAFVVFLIVVAAGFSLSRYSAAVTERRIDEAIQQAVDACGTGCQKP